MTQGVEMIEYQAGSEIQIDDMTVVITSRRSNSGTTRYGWYAPAAEVGGEGYKATAALAVEDAVSTLTGPRCFCGDPATMIMDTRRVCGSHAS